MLCYVAGALRICTDGFDAWPLKCDGDTLSLSEGVFNDIWLESPFRREGDKRIPEGETPMPGNVLKVRYDGRDWQVGRFEERR